MLVGAVSAVLLVSAASASAYFGPGTALTGPSSAGFGNSLALSADGTTAIVGAPGAQANGLNNPCGSTGEALVFVDNGGSWSQQATLSDCDDPGSAGVGTSVALSADGNTAVLGAPNGRVAQDRQEEGEAFVFSRIGSTWNEVATLAPPSTSLEGVTVAISGNGQTILLGGAGNNVNAWVYQHVDGAWVQTAQLYDQSVSDAFSDGEGGVSLSYDGTAALVGEIFYPVIAGIDGPGAAQVWNDRSGTWTNTATLTWPGAGEAGISVGLSADGQTAILGSNYPGPSFNSEARVFSGTDGTWSTGTYVANGGSASYPGYGTGITADGNTAIVANGDYSAEVLSDTAPLTLGLHDLWLPGGPGIDSPTSSGVAGLSTVAISADGSTAIVGASDNGVAWVYSNQPSTPTCFVTAVRRSDQNGFTGAYDQQDVTVAAGNGLASISNVAIANGTVSYSLTPGTTTPTVVTATKAAQGTLTSWSFDATDDAGNLTHCQ